VPASVIVNREEPMTDPIENDSPTCGEELAASAEVPEAWRDLMRHVAINLEAHASWVGMASPAARAEHEGMLRVAAAYRDMADAAERAAVLMRSLRALPAAPHDPAAFDRAAFASWMRAKIDRQRALAALIEHHAAVSERALESMALTDRT
jgi:hypothetical protein